MKPSSQSPSERASEETEIKETLRDKEAPVPDFEPVVISGEYLSATVLRERR
jgi:hypothetical protein